MDGEILYKKEKDQVLRRYVDASESPWIVEEIHDRICETHANGHKMSRQIMRAGYYLLLLENDCIQFARKCHKF